MNLTGMMLCRNEAHQIGLTSRVALQWCDQLVVGLHACTDNSESILYGIELNETPGRLHLLDLAGESWDEMSHRQAVLNEARERGATHLAIIDADEILAAPQLPYGGQYLERRHDGGHDTEIRALIYAMPQGACLQLPGYNLRGSLNSYHLNGIWGQRWFSLAFKDNPALSWSGDKFHDREPHPRLTPYQPIPQGQCGVLHLWGASERRLRAKHALYKVTERLRWHDRQIRDIEQMYNLWRSPRDSVAMFPDNAKQNGWDVPWTFTDVPKSWWEPYAHLLKYLDIDAEPWQEQAVRDLVSEHGKERFAGLDLFGIA